MTFASDQQSVSDSAPIELYEFVTPQTTYYRTTFQEDYSYGGHLYAAVPSMRSSIVVVPPGSSDQIEISIPASDSLIQENIVGVPAIARTQIDVTVRRLQQLSGAAVIWWQGPVRGVSLSGRGRVAVLRIPDGLEDALRAELPRPRAQRLCNHALYDTMCKVVEADHTLVTTAGTIDGSVVGVAAVDAAENYKGGTMIFNNERRTIVDQFGTGNRSLQLDAPFRSLTAGSTVSIVGGCDHVVTTCRDGFNNVLNFGGHPGLPKLNPHVYVRTP